MKWHAKNAREASHATRLKSDTNGGNWLNWPTKTGSLSIHWRTISQQWLIQHSTLPSMLEVINDTRTHWKYVYKIFPSQDWGHAEVSPWVRVSIPIECIEMQSRTEERTFDDISSSWCWHTLSQRMCNKLQRQWDIFIKKLKWCLLCPILYGLRRVIGSDNQV